MPRNPNGAGIMAPAPKPRVNAAQRRADNVAQNYLKPGQRVNAADRRMINQGLIQDPRSQGRAPQQSFQPPPQMPKAQMPTQPPIQQPQPGMPPRNTGPMPFPRPYPGNMPNMPFQPGPGGVDPGFNGGWSMKMPGTSGLNLNFPQRPQSPYPQGNMTRPGFVPSFMPGQMDQMGVRWNGGAQGFNENASAARAGMPNVRTMYGGPYRG